MSGNDAASSGASGTSTDPPAAAASTASGGSAANAGAGGTPSAPDKKPREMRVFRPTDAHFNPRTLDLPDDFYSPTTADVQTSYASLSSRTHAMGEAPLMTKKMRDAEQARRMSRFRKVLIRARFPDRTAIQGTFEPASTVREVVKFVNSALRDAKSTKFHLFLSPPKTILKDLDATLFSLGLAPAALLHIGIDSAEKDSAVLLSDDAIALLEDSPAPGAPVYSATAPHATPESTGKSSTSAASKVQGQAKTGKSKSSMPKWLPKRK